MEKEILEELKKQTKILQSIEHRLEEGVSVVKKEEHLMFDDLKVGARKQYSDSCDR